MTRTGRDLRRSARRGVALPGIQPIEGGACSRSDLGVSLVWLFSVSRVVVASTRLPGSLAFVALFLVGLACSGLSFVTLMYSASYE